MNQKAFALCWSLAHTVRNLIFITTCFLYVIPNVNCCLCLKPRDLFDTLYLMGCKSLQDSCDNQCMCVKQREFPLFTLKGVHLHHSTAQSFTMLLHLLRLSIPLGLHPAPPYARFKKFTASAHMLWWQQHSKLMKSKQNVCFLTFCDRFCSFFCH